MSLHPDRKLIRFEESISETKLVVMIRQEPEDILGLTQLEFTESYDDLDYLVFATLTLPSQNRVALVRHQNSPQPGIEIYVKRDLNNTLEIIQEALTEMNLTIKDLIWIHPEYERKIYSLPVL